MAAQTEVAQAVNGNGTVSKPNGKALKSKNQLRRLKLKQRKTAVQSTPVAL